MSENVNDYIFYADCHGLISISPFDFSILKGIEMSIHANPQRFPVYGTITLDDEMVDILNDMCKNDDDKKVALNAIKGCKYNFPISNLGHYISNMKRIPNDSLDPYYSTKEDMNELNKEVHELLNCNS